LSLLALLSGHRDRKLSNDGHRADRQHHHSGECANSAYWNQAILYHALLPVAVVSSITKNSYILLSP
jgi:hypothetical protein